MQTRRDINRYPGWYRTLATCIAISFGFVEAVDFPTRYAMAQTLPGTPPSAPAQPAAPEAKLDQPQLEQLLAPVALYPDNLLALVLMASTYPLEVVQAERWLTRPGNDKLKGPGLEQALQSQSWDPSVKSLVAFPLALKLMTEQLEWTQKLGDAVLAQQQDVLNAVQALRARAQKAGKLESGPQQKVSVAPNTAMTTPAAAPGPAPASGSGGSAAPAPVTTQANYAVPPPQEIISIEPTQPEQVYVPAYDPNVVYGSWPYPSYPPSYYPPPPYYGLGSAMLTGMAFAGGAALIGAACCWANTGWNNGSLNVNNSRVTNIDRTGVANGNWQHRAEHRQGVGYRNQDVQNRFQQNRTDRTASREQFRGRVGDQGGGLGNRDGGNRAERGNAGANRPGGGNLGAGANRPGGGGNLGANARPGGGQGGPGGNRAATRPANAGAGRGVAQARNGRPNPGGGAAGGRQFASAGGGFGGVGQGAQVRAASDRGQFSRQSPASPSFGGGGRGGGQFGQAGGGGFSGARAGGGGDFSGARAGGGFGGGGGGGGRSMGGGGFGGGGGGRSMGGGGFSGGRGGGGGGRGGGGGGRRGR